MSGGRHRTGRSYRQQLAAKAEELLPGIGLEERLALLGVMHPGDMSASLAWLASFDPAVFTYALVRDEEMTLRLLDRLDEDPDDDGLTPYCSACGADIGIFLGQGDAWHHWRGEGTAASPVELYDAGHAPAVAWREAGAQ